LGNHVTLLVSVEVFDEYCSSGKAQPAQQQSNEKEQGEWRKQKVGMK
jgi:hypothetical protein